MQLVGIFPRRDPAQLEPLFDATQVFAMDDLMSFKDKIDVLILCGGSKDDLPVQGPQWAQHFNIVDSFDTHARIPEYFKERSEEHTSELQSRGHLVCRLLRDKIETA